MKSYRKKGSVKSAQFNRKEHMELLSDEKAMADLTDEERLFLKRIKKTPQGFFCSSSSGMRPISDGSWICYDQGRVFTMSDKDFVGKFEEVVEGEGAGSELYDELALEFKTLRTAHEQLILEYATFRSDSETEKTPDGPGEDLPDDKPTDEKKTTEPVKKYNK